MPFAVELAPAHFPPKLTRPCPPSVSEDVRSHPWGSGKHEPRPPPHGQTLVHPLSRQELRRSVGFRSTGRPAPREACRACGEQPQAPEHSPGDTGVACEPSSGVVPWALPLRASVNQDSAPVLTGPRPPRALPRPGPPCASPHIPNIPAEPSDVGCGHLWEGCHEAFLPIWPIRNPTHRELERQVGGRPAGQRQSELKARELG